jgi:hypothetical protein
MGHWQILWWLMVVELWSEIAQDKFIKNKESFCAQGREKC